MATRTLGRLYGAARLYVNFFQPSFKLRDKRREGAKIKKSYHAPATPCDRLLADPRVTEQTKAELIRQRSQLDPLALLHQVRACQETLASLAGRTAPTDMQQSDIKQFLKALPVLWKEGEARPTHRKKHKSPRTHRTRPDPFEAVWPEATQWLDQHPEGNAKELLEALCAQHPGAFKPGQLRTLQRRVREWRAQRARDLILPGAASGAVDEWLSGEAAE